MEGITHTTAPLVNARAAQESHAWRARPLTRDERTAIILEREVFELRERAERAINGNASDAEILRCVLAFLAIRGVKEGRVTTV